MQRSNELRIFVECLPYYVFHIISDMLFGIFFQLIGINRFPVFNYHMGFLYFRKMVFKDLGGIVHRDGNNRTSGLRGNLQGSVAERKHGQLFAPVALPFREDADGNPGFNIIDCLKDGFPTVLWVVAITEETFESWLFYTVATVVAP